MMCPLTTIGSLTTGALLDTGRFSSTGSTTGIIGALRHWDARISAATLPTKPDAT